MSSRYSNSPATDRPRVAPIPDSGIVSTLARMAWQVLAATGLASILLGVIVLAWPGATLFVVGILFGTYLLISGVFQIAGAVGHHVPGHLRAIGLVTGALSIVLGLICFRGPAESILLLALWIGFSWLMRGIGQAVTVASAPAFSGRGWLIAGGVIMAIAGVVIVTSPITSIATLTLIAGIWLIVIGISEVMEAIRLRRATRR